MQNNSEEIKDINTSSYQKNLKIFNLISKLIFCAGIIFGIGLVIVFIGIKQAKAEQIKVLSNDSEATAIVSNYDLTRIKIINDKIKKLRYNTGELSVAEDNTLGEIYIRPTNTSAKKNINLFLISERGYVYKLLLTPKKVPSEQIFIKHKNTQSTNWIEQGDYNGDNNTLNFDDPYKSTTITLIKAMTNREPLNNFTIEERGNKIKFKKGIKIKWEISYLSNNLTGEIFSVKNISKDPVTLNEKDFLTRGILAAKADKITLQPNEITSLYLVGGFYGRE
jgi:type-F conjugative transfer system secretin TraK